MSDWVALAAITRRATHGVAKLSGTAHGNLNYDPGDLNWGDIKVASDVFFKSGYHSKIGKCMC